MWMSGLSAGPWAQTCAFSWLKAQSLDGNAATGNYPQHKCALGLSVTCHFQQNPPTPKGLSRMVNPDTFFKYVLSKT